MADPFLDALYADYDKRRGTSISQEDTVKIDERPEQEEQTGFVKGATVPEPTVIELGQEAGTRAAEVVEEVVAPPDMEATDPDALAFDDRVTLVNMEARKRGTNFRTHMEKWVAINRDPEGFVQMIMNMDDEQATQTEAEMNDILQQGLEVFRKANPDLPADAVGIDERGIPYIKLTHDGIREYISLDLWTQLRDEKFKIGGSVLGSGGGMVAALKSPKGRAITGAVSMLSNVLPQGKYARQIGGLLNNVAKPFVYSNLAGGAGAGIGQGVDDFYNSLYTATRLKTGLAFRRAGEAALADIADGAVLGPLSHVGVGVAYTGTKVVWNTFLGKLFPPGLGTVGGLLFPSGPKMFDDKLVRASMIQLGLDPDDVVQQQQVREATKEFLGRTKTKDLPSALGLKYGSEAAEFTRPRALDDALEKVPLREREVIVDGVTETIPETTEQGIDRVFQQEKLFKKFFGESAQARFNAQKRLNELTKEYPGLAKKPANYDGVPADVEREVGMLKAGLYGASQLNQVSSTLVNPSFWSGDRAAGLLFNDEFGREVGKMATGFQLSRWRLFGPKAKETGTIPPAIAAGMRGEALGKPLAGAPSVLAGINMNKKARKNALTYLQGMSNIARDALSSPEALSFDPLAYRQITSMVEVNYDAALQATKAYATNTPYSIISKGGMDPAIRVRALREAETRDGPSVDFIKQLNEKIRPGKPMSMKELVDLSVWIRTWTRQNDFDGERLPLGQKLLNETLVNIEGQITKDLGKTAEGKLALKALNEFRQLKKQAIEVRSNRVYQDIEAYVKDNVKGDITPENFNEIGKIIGEHAVSGDSRSMTLLLNKLPRLQRLQLTDYLFNASVKRNTATTEDGYQILNFGAVYRELSALGGVKDPQVKQRMEILKAFSDVLGGAAHSIGGLTGTKGTTKSLFRQAFEGVGAGGLGTDFGSRAKVATVTGIFNMARLTVFNTLGWLPGKTGGGKVYPLAKATANFFQNPLDANLSSRLQSIIRDIKADAVKHEDIYQEVEAVEQLVRQVKDAAYYSKAAASP